MLSKKKESGVHILSISSLKDDFRQSMDQRNIFRRASAPNALEADAPRKMLRWSIDQNDK